MATTTPNFGWAVPTSTDLVKDGATAIETLGDSIDASLVDLKGGTTGQVLSKATNADMDFTWVAQDDSNAIQNAIVDAKGDLITATANDTPARLAVGTNGQVLKANSATATGLEWGAASSTDTWTLLNAGGTALSGAATLTVSGISNQKKLGIFLDNPNTTSGSGATISMRFNGDSTTKYIQSGFRLRQLSSYAYNISGQVADIGSPTTQFTIVGQAAGSGSMTASIFVDNTDSTSSKPTRVMSGVGDAGFASGIGYLHQGFYTGASTISSVTVLTDLGTFNAGRIYIYGAA
jgi:hypothetical protein